MVGIILAAGLSTRMGRPKQLLPLGYGEAVIDVVVQAARSHLSRVIVVVGHRGAEIADHLAPHDVAVVTNPSFERGMLSSVQCGVRAAGEAAGYLICLGDQPAMDGQVVGAVVAAAVRSGKGIVIPTHRGRGGHPVYVGRRYGAEVLSLTGEEGGLRAVTRGHPDDTLELEVNSPLVLEDMDTPADYERECQRRGIAPVSAAGSPEKEV
ncbi:NTP transferase domain-containing protein [Candidatus Latescibacterota bacterium]